MWIKFLLQMHKEFGVSKCLVLSMKGKKSPDHVGALNFI
jgi:hypothetical protein